MAKRQRKVKKKDTARIPGEAKAHISSEAKREIAAIVLITIAVFLILAMIGFAGSLGGWIFMAVGFVIGLAAFVLPFALLLIAWVLFQPSKYEFKPNNLFGTIAVFICLAGLAHMVFAPENVDFGNVGSGGGMVGFGLSAAMLPILNKPVSIFILVALLLICLVVATNTRVKDLFTSFLSLFMRERSSDGEVMPDTKVQVNNKLEIKGSIGSVEPELKKKEATATLSTMDKDWKYPPLDLVKATSTQADPGDASVIAKTIKDTFAEFNYGVTMGEVDVGPTVSQYSLKPPSGVNLNKLTALDRNLALALEAEQVRIEAPIPGKSLVGIQVPNKKAAQVRLGDILASKEVQGKGTKLTFVLGRDVSGDIVVADLGKAPHLLVAGATGSGKSVMVNTLITSLLYRNSPSEMKLILVDPKRVELSSYDDIPHLLTPVIKGSEPEQVMQAISALKWAVAEMDRRYRLLQDHGKRGIDEFNAQKDVDSMPYIVIVVDEFADLMVVAGKDIEMLIQRLTQMARAVGIHLVLATQRPSVNVITGVIKANVPSRIALTTTSQEDSRTIIGMAGAEKLLGKGDMLFMSPSFIKPKRVQGVWLSEEEVKAVADYLRDAREPEYDDEILKQAVRIKGGGGGAYGTGDDDLFDEVAELAIQSGEISASTIQRRFKVGFSRAGRLIDMLEDRGVVGPKEGAKPRKTLVSSMNDLGEGGDSDSEI